MRSRNPKTFQQKIFYKMAYDRRNIVTLFADKVLVRDYVAKIIGNQYLIPIYGIYQTPEEISLNDLPDKCVIKPSHGSGAILIFSTRNQNSSFTVMSNKFENWKRIEIQKSAISEADFKLLLKGWLKTPYHNGFGHFPEFAYKGVTPKLIIEDLLTLEDEIAADYRFFIFNGVCEYIEVDQSWNESPTRDMFNSNWQKLDVKLKYPNAKKSPVRPSNLGHMIHLAEKLACNVDHLRVDFYLIGDRIYFGELTNYHTGGKQIFEPRSFNTIFSKSWDPTTYY